MDEAASIFTRDEIDILLFFVLQVIDSVRVGRDSKDHLVPTPSFDNLLVKAQQIVLKGNQLIGYL